MPFSLFSFPLQNLDSSELIKKCEALSKRFPFLTLQTLGKSILGKEIPLFILGKGKKKLLFVGTHHGMEWITSYLLLRFIEDFCLGVEAKKCVYHLFLPCLWEEYSLHVVPMLNPDGADYEIHGVTKDNPLYERLLAMNGGKTDFSHWQANARGVDLNHNYDAGFAEYKKLEAENGIKDGAPTRFSGQEPESEPETKALCNYIRFFKEDWKLILSLHTQGEEIYDHSGNVTHEKLPQISEKISCMTGYTVSNPEGLACYGGLTDWCLQKMHLPAITLECGLGVNPLPLSDFPLIYARLRETFFRLPSLT